MQFIHAGRKEFVKELEQNRLVLFGASFQPQEVWKDLLLDFEIDISEFVDLMVDNSEKKHGENYAICNKTFVIQNPSELKKIDWGTNVLLITSRYYLDIMRQLEEMPELNEAHVYAWPCVTLDKERTIEDKYEIRIRQEALLQYDFWLGTTGFAEITKKALRIKMRKKIYADGYRVIPRVTVMHSNICSLHCSQCCDMIPQVKKPYYIPAKDIIGDLELLLSGVDLCMSLDLTDGEGLLYKELDALLEYSLKNPKIATVLLISNGTIMPKHSLLKLMQHPKFWIAISDYGIEEKSNNVLNALRSYGINHVVIRDFVWKDLKVNNIKKRSDSRDMIRYEFLRCRNKLCSKAYIGKRLYACMPSFRMANLDIFESDKDYVLLDEKDTPEQIWNKLYHICMLDYIDACDYCNFENTGVDIIPVGS
ncbi:radical SAM protein [Butyrivibrio sp. VCD2006]|uniref:radical SAM protein n=1 Tax=Butyrivibrio sp. VCD2006 TaxID=1280664 RepID=UPI0003FC52BC|nr:radical SAM protein [Butyrivibrio sp. VCD2006]